MSRGDRSGLGGERSLSALRAAASRRLPGAALVCVLSAALLPAQGDGAISASAGHVLAPGGKVDGVGYPYFLKRQWQIIFHSAPPAPKPCQITNAGGKAVAMLIPAPASSARYTCSEPASRTIYVFSGSNECSTLLGDHNGFGTTAAALRRCARAGFAGAGIASTASVDGRAVANFSRFITATRVYPIHLPKRNLFGVPKQDGRSAAYGYGLLLEGLKQGVHTVVIRGREGSRRLTVTWTLHVS